jgi:Mce-associated membrane protein
MTSTQTKRRAKSVTDTVPPNFRLVLRGGVVLAALVVVLLGISATLAAVWWNDGGTQQARSDALVAANGDVRNLLSYNYKTLDHDVSAAEASMTPQMASSYSHYWSQMRSAVVQAQTVVQTTTQAGGVISASPNRVEVLLFVEMLSVNKSHPKTPEVDEPHLTLVMEKQHGKWLIAGPLMNGSGAPPGTTMSPTATPTPRASR